MTSDLWVTLYEPHSLNQMVGQDELVNMFKGYVKDRHIPNMTIAGIAGCGKTLLMKCFAADLGFIKFVDDQIIELIPGQFYLFNASTDRKIENVRTTITRLAHKPTIGDLPRLIVLDEFNYTDEAQAAMRSLMQECSNNVRFILLSNDPSSIIAPIISRCPIKIAQPLTLENMKTIVANIQKTKQFTITPEAIEYLYKLTNGDARQFIGELQNACTISNFNVQIQHIQIDTTTLMTAKSILEISQTDYYQAKDITLTIFSKTQDAKGLLEKLYEAASLTKFSEIMPDNEIIQRRIKERIAEADYRLTQGVNPIVQLDAVISYIQLIKYIPLRCPRAK